MGDYLMGASPSDEQFKATIETTDWTIYLDICEAINYILICVITWILLGMIVHGKRTGKWQSKKESRRIYNACFIAVFVTLPKYITSAIHFQVDQYDDTQTCATLFVMDEVTTIIAILPTYVFLWMRQRVIHNHDLVKHLTGNLTNIVSWLILLLLSVVFLPIPIMAIADSSMVCAFSGTGNETMEESGGDFTVFILVELGSKIALQIALLCLFLQPMVRVRKAQLHHSTQSDVNRERSIILSTIRRSSVGTAIAIVSDSVTAILILCALPSHRPEILHNTLVGVDVILNVFAIVCIFPSYRQILLPCCNKNKYDQQRQNGPSVTTARSRSTGL